MAGLNQVTNAHLFKYGDVIQMELADFPHEPLRTFSSSQFPPRASYRLADGSTKPQRYRVTEWERGTTSAIIFYRRHYAASYFVEGHNTLIMKVEPLPVHENAVDESYTGIHWFIDVTHMSICQDVDAMPINIITKMYLVSPDSLDNGDTTKQIPITPPLHQYYTNVPSFVHEEAQQTVSGAPWMVPEPPRNITDGVRLLDAVAEDEEDTPQRTITGALW